MNKLNSNNYSLNISMLDYFQYEIYIMKNTKYKRLNLKNIEYYTYKFKYKKFN